jgi:BlaI family penicillinase repressor
MHDNLSRRERQIMNVLLKCGRATAAEVQQAIPGGPGYSAIRALLRTLEDKGHIRHEEDGPRYVYTPAIGRERARKGALRHLVDTYFGGSVEQAVAGLLDASAAKLDGAELDRLARLVDQARKEKSK